MSSVKDSKKIHVLHVDDDASFLEVTKQILELEAGFTVESAVSADEAIKKLSTTVYDIVVSDFEMPQKDGLIFLKELREQNSHIPFVLFTGKGREEVAIKALNMGANGYYNKQGSPETVYGELIHGIKLCVELKRSADLNKLAEARFSAAFNLNSVALCISDFETGLFIDCNEQFVNLFGYSREELIGRQSALILYTNPLDRQQILDLLNKNRHLLNYEVNFKTKSGKLITALFSAKLIEVKNQIQILTTILNISESKQMKEKLKTFAHLQATVAELGQYALTQPTIDDFLDKVANDVASALDVELCKVLELLPDREYLLLRAGVGWKKGLVGKAIVDAGDTSQAGYTLKSKTPIIVDDLRTEKRFSGPALLHNHSVISGLSVIIGSLEKPFGILGAHTTHHQQFTKDDVNFMLSIANLIDAFIKLKNDKLELRKNELKFRTIADFARDWVYWISPERKFIYVSPSCEVITGYTANEFIDNPCLMRDIVVSEDKMIFGNHFDLFSSDTDHRLTFRIKTKTGQIRWIAHICQPVFDDLGNWLGRRATNIDITELKKVEHQLRASERRWAVTLSSIGDGVIATDVLGKVSFMNSVAEQLTGWT
ncbi:MAG: PAS domain S-box protein, partial [Candidatus Bathyarchaeota archaeon]|nr:PAS domain S-box protein [Candidatus Bathyarchaeota archaeon]